MQYDLSDRRALITGAGDGVGREISIAMAGEGAIVLAVDRSEKAAAATVAAITDRGGKAFAYKLDVSDFEGCQTLAEEILEQLGPVQILINNAGIGRGDKFGDPEFLSKWREVMDVNLNGTLYCCLAFMDQLKNSKGTIVNIASIGSTNVSNSSPAYTTSKGAVMQLTRALARDLAPFDVRVNAVAPAMLKTSLTERARQDRDLVTRIEDRTMMKRLGEPREIVGPVIFLATGMSSFMTGAMVYVDGGTTAL